MRTYSQSEFREWMHCHRAHGFRYGQGLSTKQMSHALQYGRVFHQALAMMYEGKGVDAAIAHAEELRPSTEEEEAGYEHPYGDEETIVQEIARLAAHLAAYANYYNVQDDGCEEFGHALAVELEFECRIPDFTPDWKHEYEEYGIKGIMDGLILDRHDKVWLLETKTAAQIDPSVLANLSLDFQTNLYLMCARIMFDNGELPFLPSAPVGVCYNITEKPKQRVLSGVFDTILSDGQMFAGTKRAGTDWMNAQGALKKNDGFGSLHLIEQVKRPESLPEYGARIVEQIGTDQRRFFIRDWHRFRDEHLSDTMNTVRALIREIETGEAYPNQMSCSRCSFKDICKMPRSAWADVISEQYISRLAK